MRLLLALFEWLIKATGPHMKPQPVNLPPENSKPTEVPPVVEPVLTPAERIVEAARAALGKDITPDDRIPDEVACVTQLVAILPADFGVSKKLTYTPDLLKALKANLKFKPVLDPTPGTIVVSPTVGSNVGHCGIYIAHDSIASNNSFGPLKGKWTANYTRQSWINYFYKSKGLKGYLFAPR